MYTLRYYLPVLATLISLSGCVTMPELDEVVKDRSVEYKSSSSLPPLEVPPDLTSSQIQDSMVVPEVAPASGTASYSDYAADRKRTTVARKILYNPEGISIERDGDKRWLVLDGEAGQYWDNTRSFWLDNGLLLKVEDPAVGIMETDWAENRADIPESWLRETLGGLLDQAYSAATRDKFRVRFEHGIKPGTTELFLSHTGAQEVSQGENFVWEPRPSDPEIEALMLQKLVVYLGVKENKAKHMMATAQHRGPKASLVRTTSGNRILKLTDNFSRAWRRVGLALDRIGFTVEDRDRSHGLYFVRYADPMHDDSEKEGLLSNLAFWNTSKKPTAVEYLISLKEKNDSTYLNVLNKSGKRDTGKTASRILNLLFEQLK